MKRKAIILLSSILAGSLLVGGAFAAWAVTDNADPLGIHVSPGDISHSTLDYVTLEWGTSTKLSDLSEIKAGENRKAGVVYLKSTDTTYTGKFTVSFQDDSPQSVVEGKETTDPYLRDYLDVRVYAGEVNLGENGALPTGTPVLTLGRSDEAEDGVKSKSYSTTGTAAGAPLTVIVSLDVSAGAESVKNKIKDDNVSLTVDWAPASDKDIATDRLVYAEKPSAWDHMYVYAFDHNGKDNGGWPGVEMDYYASDVYSKAIPAGMEFVVFNAGDSVAEHQTENIPLTGYTSVNKYWNGTAWDEIPAARNYYLVGTFDGATWTTPNTHQFVVNPSNPNEYVLENVELTIPSGKEKLEFKAAYFDGIHAVKDNEYIPGPTEDVEGNLEITASGTYTFYFTPTARDDWATGNRYNDQFAYGKHFWVVPYNASPAPSGDIPEGKELQLTVNLGEFASDNAVCFIHYWGEGITAGDVKVVAGQATIHSDYQYLQVVRMPAGSTELDYTTKLNESNDLAKGTGTLTFKDWGEGWGSKANFHWVTPAP